MLARSAENGLFTAQFRSPIHSRGSALLVLPAWRVVRLLSEDIVRGDVDEQSSHLLHHGSHVARCHGIESLGQCGRLRVTLSPIHVGEGRTVHNDLHPLLPHEGAQGFQVGDVEVGGGQSLHLVHVRKDITI